MANTELKTVSLPNISSDGAAGVNNPGPANIAYAAGGWRRVLVANISIGIDVILAFDVGDAKQVPMAINTFKLQAGKSEVIPLAPGQKLYASAIGSNAEVSVAISDALPADISPAS